MVVGLLPAFGCGGVQGGPVQHTAQPGWKDARWLGGYLVNSALMLGAAELLLIAALTGGALAVDVLRPAVGLLLALNLLALALLVGDVRPLLSRLYARRELGMAGLCVLLIGFVIPAAALLAGDAHVTAPVTMTALLLTSLAVRIRDRPVAA